MFLVVSQVLSGAPESPCHMHELGQPSRAGVTLLAPSKQQQNSTISILIVFPLVPLCKDVQGSGILLSSPVLGHPHTAPS